MRRRVLAVLWVCAFFALPPAAHAQSPSIEVRDGVTQPVFGYADAIRQRVWVDCTACDGDHDGVADRVALDIIRPAATANGLKVPVIMDASPYYTTVCRGNESECINDVDGDGINDKWPLFYDNYFVPRGYAVVLLDVDGTGNSSGCTDEGGRNDILSAKAGIDWLNGRATAHDAQGNEVVADWDNGKAAMIGKSYDGTIANGVAATGVEGLTTIVPISAISSWYDYRRMGGITFTNNYPASLSNTVTNPDRRAYCAPSRDLMSANDGDETGDYTAFWRERDYNPDVGNVHAAVFASHGINDDNVRPNHFSQWWAGLAAHHVPRKVWLADEGHVDPFDYRRAEWVDTLHRWFDHWLYGIDNGIMDEPMVDIERSPDVWETHSTWPLPHTVDTHVWLQPGSADGPGGLGLTPAPGAPQSRSFQDSPGQSETTMIANPTTTQPGRLVYLSGPLTHDLHVSGTPTVELHGSADKDQTNLGALLVDYGAATHETRSNDGVRNTTTTTCWGESSAMDDPCYLEVTKPLIDVTSWRVSKGILDSSNRDSIVTSEPMLAGTEYTFPITLLPTDYVFPAGHQIGVILVASYRQFPEIVNQSQATITADEKLSRLDLPIVGGYQAATAIQDGPGGAPAHAATRDERPGWSGERAKGLEVPR